MRLAVYICLILVSFSCSKSDVDVPNLGYDYYPVIKGKYIIYEVEEYLYDDFDTTVEISIYQLKELMDSSITDLEGRTAVQLKRYTRLADSIPWTLKENWTFYKGEDQLEINESNTVFVKMVFPLRRSKSWDGNARNNLTHKSYSVIDLDLKLKIGETDFDKITRINHISNVNLIEEQVKEEIYASEVGLVEIRDVDLKYDVDGAIVSGRDYSQVYLEHGIE